MPQGIGYPQQEDPRMALAAALLRAGGGFFGGDYGFGAIDQGLSGTGDALAQFQEQQFRQRLLQQQQAAQSERDRTSERYREALIGDIDRRRVREQEQSEFARQQGESDASSIEAFRQTLPPSERARFDLKPRSAQLKLIAEQPLTDEVEQEDFVYRTVGDELVILRGDQVVKRLSPSEQSAEGIDPAILRRAEQILGSQSRTSGMSLPQAYEQARLEREAILGNAFEVPRNVPSEKNPEGVELGTVIRERGPDFRMRPDGMRVTTEAAAPSAPALPSLTPDQRGLIQTMLSSGRSKEDVARVLVGALDLTEDEALALVERAIQGGS